VKYKYAEKFAEIHDGPTSCILGWSRRSGGDAILADLGPLLNTQFVNLSKQKRQNVRDFSTKRLTLS
jgi:hypothetical protein